MSPAPSPRLFALCRRGGSVGLWTRTLVQARAEAAKLKTIDDLPGPTLSTTLFWLFVKGYADKSHLLQCVQKSLYGPIWRSKFGPLDLVNVASPDLIAQVIHQEGRYPVRAELPHWKEYRDLRGQAYGLHVDKGQEWYRIRSALNPKMLKLQEVSAYAPIIHQVVEDLLQRIEFLRSCSPDRASVLDVTAELYKFGFEGISSILFETRLGCLQENIPQDTARFIAAVNDMLTLSEIVVICPRWTYRILPFWKRFVQAWDDLYDTAQRLIDIRLADIQTQTARGELTEGLYLTYLLSCKKITQSEIYISVTELLLGGVDTGRGHAGAYPRAGGGIHPELVASQSQGTYKQTTIHTHSHIYGQFRVSNSCVFLGCGRKPECPEKTHAGTGEDMQTPHRQDRGLNPGPQNCEADALTSRPPCRHLLYSMSKLSYEFGYGTNSTRTSRRYHCFSTKLQCHQILRIS
ncbi:sterol 26-hydroxylase, mitochondrial isoform X3 [Phyllopteryx taeniolatus]|uniref:sterol 26-hydroxylase, mitochondrial isoform X3 n=1 Tax=Phyllopteryx taeniolatus TaxID=161469 RepID=UPI002AD45F62|nr:sterol 26-hydroxylase, mitochondrial isoform X3 [Phyllopteryx taeniolatus]